MKILNLYAGIGGNRKLWTDVQVTAVEYDPRIAAVYKDMFPDDELIVGDAHEYLLQHFTEYDFIWTSPPCQSHSQMRKNMAVDVRGSKPLYPDMKLYEEIILLQHYFKGAWVVENVRPYYDYLIEPTFRLGRHPFWSNMPIKDAPYESDGIKKPGVAITLAERYGYDLDKYDLPNKRQILRNCVNPEMGKYVIEAIRHAV